MIVEQLLNTYVSTDREMVMADILTKKAIIILASIKMIKVMGMVLCISQMALLFHKGGGKMVKLSEL